MSKPIAKHPDGSNCYTKNCKIRQVNVTNAGNNVIDTAIHHNDINSYLEEREIAMTLQPRDVKDFELVDIDEGFNDRMAAKFREILETQGEGRNMRSPSERYIQDFSDSVTNNKNVPEDAPKILKTLTDNDAAIIADDSEPPIS